MTHSLEELKPFIEWLQHHPGLAALAVFAISCAESLAIIGLFIPGTIVMPAIGSMIGSGVLPPYFIISAAILGAIVGDSSSYWLGRYFHQGIRKLWPFYHYPQLLSKGEHFFNQYGGLSVFIGRFAGPIRPIIPVVAGMLNMPSGRFFIANLTSAISWAILYMAPGILLGYISKQLAPHAAARLLIILAIATFLVWLLWWICTKIWQWLQELSDRFIQKIWSKMPKHALIKSLFTHPIIPNSHKPLAFFIYPFILMGILAIITYSVAHQGIISYLDWPIYLFFKSIQIEPLDIFNSVLISFSSFITLKIVIGAVFVWLMMQRAWRAAFCWLANPLLCLATCYLVKLLAHIPRPGFSDITPTFWSYPSLHAALFSAIIGNFIIFAYYRPIWQKYQHYFLYGVMALFILIIMPQLYFGTNWFSDQIAAALCAIITTHFMLLVYHHQHKSLVLKPLFFIALLAWIIPGVLISSKYTEEQIQSFDKPSFTYNFRGGDWWLGRTLPVALYRTNFFGEITEPLTIQYAGPLHLLRYHLKMEGWQEAPKPDLAVIINRIAAKDRNEQLPLLPDLYHAQKPSLIMTKWVGSPSRMLILRLWPSEILLQPTSQPLWLGTIKIYQVWRFKEHPRFTSLLEAPVTPLMILQEDLADFVTMISTLGATTECVSIINHISCQEPILKIATPDWFKLISPENQINQAANSND